MESLSTSGRTYSHVFIELEELRARLFEAEQTLDAIRSGEVDALVVYGEKGERVYTLTNADQPYRVFVETMKEGAVTLAENGTILYCNQGFSDMAAVPLEKLMGSSIEGLLVTRDGDSLIPLLADIRDEGMREEMAVVGQSRALAALVSISRLDTDGPVSFALTVTDLSRQREQEDQLKHANTELEGFCYSVAHDLRAPLRSIVGSAHILLQDYAPNLPNDAVTDLAQISQSATHLGMLIDDLLTYSRLARSTINWEPVDLSALAKEIVEEGIPAGSDKTRWRIHSGLSCMGDARLIKLVLENLMSNAAKYSSKRAIPLVEVGSLPGREGQRFYVKDNGIGFDMAYVDKIFLPFERLHRTADYPGTGIGLANAKRIIGKHGGRIWAESAPHKGALFYFTLPKVQ